MTAETRCTALNSGTSRFGGKVGEGVDVDAGQDEDVARKDRAAIEEPDDFGFLEHEVGGRAAGDDRAEGALAAGHATTARRAGCSDGDTRTRG